jgi:hypothetical protein
LFGNARQAIDITKATSAISSKRALKSLNNQTDFDSAIRRFDPSRPSQPVAQPERVGPYWLKVPHFMGFSCGFQKSLVSSKRQPGREFAESLQPKPQKFRF